MSDRYEKREKLGQGGLGTVYKAYDKQLRREVALKRVITPTQEAVENLLHEATSLSSLMHPNIVTVFDVGQDEEGGFVVMELLDGETLDDTISRAPLTLPDFAEVVNQTLEALIAAQAVNMTHRDLKPSNLMVIWRPSGRFQIKVLDFGLAKISEAPSPQTSDQEEGIMGSIYFMAPEQFERATLDFRTDMYAMGCIYYYCLTGVYPFDGETAPQVMMAHLYHRVRPLPMVRPDLPEEVSDWVHWLMERNRDDRPASAREALDRFPDLARPTSVSGAIPRDGSVVASPAPAFSDEEGVLVVMDDEATAVPIFEEDYAPQHSHGGSLRPVAGKARPGAARPTGAVNVATSPVWVGGADLDGEARASEEEQAAKRKKLLIIIGSVVAGLALLGLIGGFVAGKIRSSQELSRIAVLSKTPDGVPADVPLLLRHVDENPKLTHPEVMRILTQIRGEGVEASIQQALASSSPGAPRQALLKVVADRNLAASYSTVLSVYRNTPSPAERSVAAAALMKIAGPGNEKSLLDLLKLASLDPDERTRMEDGVCALLFRNSKAGARVQPILNDFESSSGPYRKSLARLLAILGGGQELFLKRLIVRLSASPAELAVALNNWPDRNGLDSIEPFLKSGDAKMKAVALQAYVRMLQLPHNKPDDSDAYRLVLESAGRTEAQPVIDAIAANPTPQTLKFCQEAKYPGLEAALSKAAEKVEKGIDDAIIIRSGDVIPAVQATILGAGDETRYLKEGELIDWKTPRSWMHWVVKVEVPGTYEVTVLGSCQQEGSDINLTFVGEPLRAKTKKSNEPLVLGTLTVKEDDRTARRLFLSAGPTAQATIMKVKGLRFEKK